MQMIEANNFWQQKTFDAVLTNLQRRWDKQIHEQEDISMYCTENKESNNKRDGVEVIDLYCVSWTKKVNETREKKAQSKKASTK